MKNFFTNNDYLINVLSNDKMIKKQADIFDINKESIICKDSYTEKEVHNLCDKLGYTFFDSYYDKYIFKDTYDDIYVNDENNTIISFERRNNEKNFELRCIAYFEDGVEKINYCYDTTAQTTHLNKILNITSHSFELTKIPMKIISLLYNVDFNLDGLKLLPTEKESNILNEYIYNFVKNKSKGTNLENKIINVLEKAYKKDLDASKKFDEMVNNIDFCHKKYHRAGFNSSITNGYYSDLSFNIAEVNKTYLCLKSWEYLINEIYDTTLYVAKDEFNNLFKDNDLLFDEYKEKILYLLKNITNCDINKAILFDRPYTEINDVDYTELNILKSNNVYYLKSENFRIDFWKHEIDKDFNIRFNFTELKNTYDNNEDDKKRPTIKGTPFDILLEYVETKDNKENINNIKYYENIQKKLNDLCFIIISLSQITSEKFTIKDYELEKAFKNGIKNIHNAQKIVSNKKVSLYKKEKDEDYLYGRGGIERFNDTIKSYNENDNNKDTEEIEL